MYYQVISGPATLEFQVLIQEYLDGGYSLAGGVSAYVVDGVAYFAQAVTIPK
jgi:Domain of unknown function (DUF1737)